MAETPRILIVDDEPAILRGFQRLLSRHAVVTCAETAPEVLELVSRGHKFDVILVDFANDVAAMLDHEQRRRVVVHTGDPRRAWQAARRDRRRVLEKPASLAEILFMFRTVIAAEGHTESRAA
jgi:CheY-like chemotaxis protein